MGAGGDGSLTLRHIKGKSATDDTPDNLYLNWNTGLAVQIGGAKRANLRVSGDAVVGAGGDGSLTLRHIKGKSSKDDAADDLYLNYDTGRAVQIGSSAERANLRVSGDAVVGVGGGDGSLTLRHIKGKSAKDDAADDLYLNYDTGRAVQIGSSAERANLRVSGDAVVGAGGGDGSLTLRHIKGKSAKDDTADNLYLNYDTGRAVQIGRSAKRANLQVSGDAVVGAGGNGSLTLRHINGKHWENDTAHELYLNWGNGQAVNVGGVYGMNVGGGARANLHVSGDAVVGAGGDGSLTARHVKGKSGKDDTADDLHLNYDTGRAVHVGGGAVAPLLVHGPLIVEGDVSYRGQLTIDKSASVGGGLTVSGVLRSNQGLSVPNGATLNSDGRLHVFGQEILFLLNKSGVVVSKAWGGTGNLRVEGKLLGEVELEGAIGTYGMHPTRGLPNGWGGGVHTWDLYAEGTIGAGPAGAPGGGVPAGLQSNGDMWAKRKTFVIDHPLDPQYRSLVHAAVEGPEIAVYYRGEGKLESGHMRVELPAYFEALVQAEGRTVQVTPICEPGGPVGALAITPVIDGAFMVLGSDAGPTSNQRFYWEVTAVRADVEPLVVEPEKSVPMIAPLKPPEGQPCVRTHNAQPLTNVNVHDVDASWPAAAHSRLPKNFQAISEASKLSVPLETVAHSYVHHSMSAVTRWRSLPAPGPAGCGRSAPGSVGGRCLTRPDIHPRSQ